MIPIPTVNKANSRISIAKLQMDRWEALHFFDKLGDEIMLQLAHRGGSGSLELGTGGVGRRCVRQRWGEHELSSHHETSQRILPPKVLPRHLQEIRIHHAAEVDPWDQNDVSTLGHDTKEARDERMRSLKGTVRAGIYFITEVVVEIVIYRSRWTGR